jgi:thiol-disulfide isomerase/thioredoxin
MKMILLGQVGLRTHKYLRTNWKSHLRTFVFAAAVVFGIQIWQTRDVPNGLAPNVEVILMQSDGTTSKSTLQDWRALHPGQPVALHFWAEWCPICRTEENSITRLTADWPVLTMAMQSGPSDNVRKVLQKRELPWNVAVDERGTATHAFGFNAVPAFVVIDAKGNLRTPTMSYTPEMGMRLRLWWASLLSV